MSTVEQLFARHAPALRGFGSSLPGEFEEAMRRLDGLLDGAQLERWADTGVTLANRSLRSWEAAAEFFRASPEVATRLDFDALMQWAEISGELAARSSVISAAFLKATPEALEQIPPDDIALWARQGEQLCRGNWKSIALSALFFSASPQLLGSLTLHALDDLVGIVDALTERSYELATTVLEHSAEIFAELAPPDREPFIDFARAVTRASWADTRLYFERGPRLLHKIDPEQRAEFLELAAHVTSEVGRRGYPLFADAAAALGEVEVSDHGDLLAFARRVAVGSATAAMEFLQSAPFVRGRLTPEQMQRWAEAGAAVLFEDRNAEGAEAYFRLESTRAEEMLAMLSARVELSSVGSTLRLYAKALTGQQISVQSTENLVDKGIGWVTESAATTEGTSIYLPPYVNSFDAQDANFQAYKVFTTHQTGRIEFGSFGYQFGVPGAYAPVTVEALEAQIRGDQPVTAATPMERLYDLFEDRLLISSLFTIVEDTRVDAVVGREYRGIRSALLDVQRFESERRPEASALALRQAYLENLLRASLGSAETIRWPRSLHGLMAEGIAALRVVEQPDATVQDSAEVAGSLYRLTERIPNVLDALEEEWIPLSEEMISVSADLPGGGEGDAAPMPSGQEAALEHPQQPEFRGDFKPELVQLMMRLREQQGTSGDGIASPLTAEQLQELLEKSVEITLSEMAEGDLASSLGLFLTDLEKEGAMPASEGTSDRQDQRGEAQEPDPEEAELPIEIDWTYYDEWDFRAADYRPRWCRVGERVAEEGELDYYEDILKRHHGLVMETRRQFEMMRPETFRKIKRLEDGEEIDLDQLVEFLVDKRAGAGPLARFYWRRNKVERDVAVAFLLDMSASTDEEIEKQRPKYEEEEDFDGDPRKYFQWLAQRRARQAIEPPKRIIDLEKEACVLVVEALEAIGDAYGIYGFSGYGRENVEYFVIKDLDEAFDDHVRKRIDKIEPIRSTRMGPAIRHTTSKLLDYDAKVRILIMVSDGRPQDHGYGRDRTEKEYAVHDTRQALLEAKRAGITPFLITVDKEGHDYLGEMCDDIGYEVVSDIESLPRRLPTLYRSLTIE